jgi:hypothetical protein
MTVYVKITHKEPPKTKQIAFIEAKSNHNPHAKCVQHKNITTTLQLKATITVNK